MSSILHVATLNEFGIYIVHYRFHTTSSYNIIASTVPELYTYIAITHYVYILSPSATIDVQPIHRKVTNTIQRGTTMSQFTRCRTNIISRSKFTGISRKAKDQDRLQ